MTPAGLREETITTADVWRAHELLRPYVFHTPLLSSATIGQMCQATVLLKGEHLQRTGSVKARGAFYKLLRLTQQGRVQEVVTASSGNHALGVALAAATLGIKAIAVMPHNAAPAKVRAAQGYGATVEFYGASFDETLKRAWEISAEQAIPLIHPFDDLDVMAGLGTVGLEILSDWPEVEMLVVPVGGGALIAGVAAVVKALKPRVRVIGVQASRMPAMLAALQTGYPIPLTPTATLADGINVNLPARRTLNMIRALVDDLVQVNEREIEASMLFLLERCKQMVEGAGAAAVAAMLSGKIRMQGKRVVPVLSGGNLDLATLRDLLPEESATDPPVGSID